MLLLAKNKSYGLAVYPQSSHVSAHSFKNSSAA